MVPRQHNCERSTTAIIPKHCRLPKKTYRAWTSTAIDAEVLTGNIRMIKKIAATAPFPVFFEPELSDMELRLYYSQPDRFVCYNKCTAAWRNVAVTPSGSMILSPLCFLPPLDCIKGRNFRERLERCSCAGPAQKNIYCRRLSGLRALLHAVWLPAEIP